MSDREAASGLSVIVPTLGHSTELVPCLEALRRDAGEVLEILLVVQGGAGVAEAERLADRVLRAASTLGFAAANNLGLGVACGAFLATVNDDAIVEEGWSRALLDALERRPEAAAAQGINVRLDDPSTVDGAGLAWNRAWQAIQIGHGRPLAEVRPESGEATEIFGVSATAAIYRRSALDRLGGFDERLFAYYEDVDLACRLRGLGASALLVPMATVRHAGSVSGRRLRGGKQRWIYRNRQLVLARLLGRAFWPRWPKILLRDVADLWRAARRGEAAVAAGIVAGVGEAFLRMPGFAHLGRPLVPLDELERFRV